jgi:hypothetical protein
VKNFNLERFLKMDNDWLKEKEAYSNGKIIEFKLTENWYEWTYTFEPHWDNENYQFRVKND